MAGSSVSSLSEKMKDVRAASERLGAAMRGGAPPAVVYCLWMVLDSGLAEVLPRVEFNHELMNSLVDRDRYRAMYHPCNGGLLLPHFTDTAKTLVTLGFYKHGT